MEEYRFLWVEALKQISQQAGQTFASILAGQQSITKGLKSLIQQFTGILWGKIFAQGADQLISSLLPSLAGKNRYGGTAFPSQAYLVGEAGPELFVPDRSGYVVRNDHLMGGGGNRQTVNVYVNGSPDKDALVATPRQLLPHAMAGGLGFYARRRIDGGCDDPPATEDGVVVGRASGSRSNIVHWRERAAVHRGYGGSCP